MGTAAAINTSMPHNCCNTLPRLLKVASAAVFVLTSSLSFATNLRLAWDPSTNANIVGYKLAYGTVSGTYTKSVVAGSATSATVTSLTPGTTYYFVVTGYNSAGLQSLPSNEVALTLPDNVPPSVSLTSPQAGTSVNGSSPVSLTATATDSDGSIVKVEFYEDSNKIGESSSAPYSATWNSPPSGNVVLTALAYDDFGAAVRSAGVSVSVTGTAPAASPSPTPAVKVRVMAMTPLIKAGQVAKFKVVASDGVLSQPMAVNYSLKGSATGGVDYSMTNVSGQITIPAGNRAALLSLTTIKAKGATGSKTAIMSVMPGTGYNPGRGEAVIKIVAP